MIATLAQELKAVTGGVRIFSRQSSTLDVTSRFRFRQPLPGSNWPSVDMLTAAQNLKSTTTCFESLSPFTGYYTWESVKLQRPISNTNAEVEAMDLSLTLCPPPTSPARSARRPKRKTLHRTVFPSPPKNSYCNMM
jgi:hypothetical protein